MKTRKVSICMILEQFAHWRVQFNSRMELCRENFYFETRFPRHCADRRALRRDVNKMRNTGIIGRDTKQADVTKRSGSTDSGYATQSNRSVMDKCICSVVRNEIDSNERLHRLTHSRALRLTKKDRYSEKSRKPPCENGHLDRQPWRCHYLS